MLKSIQQQDHFKILGKNLVVEFNKELRLSLLVHVLIRSASKIILIFS